MSCRVIFLIINMQVVKFYGAKFLVIVLIVSVYMSFLKARESRQLWTRAGA